ncbi:Thioredoxin-like protein AAED1 [Madurella mycetomatis]|uniref:Thioredoxin-like protein AAED1 n=1 Tax=Madurella mycetomatis TaxID=100816 RepID=A0A175VRQ0_9PEZI|nr:Thioredoxin-like protein AAED1 [Madurella mycetomatis]KXX80573.1 Thioredoxin-like protein AAED1 [Madurella mycetomatis]
MASANAAAPSNGANSDAKPATPEGAPPRPSTATEATPSAGPSKTTSPGRATPPLVTDHNDGINPVDFSGSVDSNHDLPTPETLRKIDKYVVLDRHGKSHTFRSLYTGRHVARRVLIIFVRHFYCGNCQDYLRSLSSAVTPSSLLALPHPSFIAVVGCGDPGLIEMYAAATGCPFPIYADPTRKLYDELGMVRSLALGDRPAYTKQHLLKSSVQSIVQGLKQIPSGLALKGGDHRQIGGEFLFEPPGLGGWADGEMTSLTSAEVQRALLAAGAGERHRDSESSLDGKDEDDKGEDKVVTWCHRMKTTRDHAEVPEIMEVLGLDGHGQPIKNRERWERAVRERKGTGVSLAGKTPAQVQDGGAAGTEAGTGVKT